MVVSVSYWDSLSDMRTFDSNIINKAVSQYAEEITGFDPDDWTKNVWNVALTNDNEDVALFQRTDESLSSFYGHYFFWSRGKQAVEAGKKFLEEFFTGPYGATTIIGLTPVSHKGALWMNKQLGFKEVDILPSIVGDLQMVLLNKTEWSDGQ